MNTNHKLISTAIAALAASTALIATPTAVGAHSPQRWDACPAADTVPLCEIVRRPNQPGSDGTEVAHRPTPADYPTDWVDNIGACRRVPWYQIVACSE